MGWNQECLCVHFLTDTGIPTRSTCGNKPLHGTDSHGARHSAHPRVERHVPWPLLYALGWAARKCRVAQALARVAVRSLELKDYPSFDVLQEILPGSLSSPPSFDENQKSKARQRPHAGAGRSRTERSSSWVEARRPAPVYGLCGRLSRLPSTLHSTPTFDDVRVAILLHVFWGNFQ